MPINIEGCTPNKHDTRDYKYDIDALMLAGAAPGDCLPEVAPVQNQGSLGSCVAHGILGSEHDTQVRAGKVLIPRSRLMVYFNARWISEVLRGRKPNISDYGTYIRAGAQAVHQYGFCDEKSHKYRELQVNKSPSMGPKMAAIGRKGINYYQIFDSGQQRLQAIDAALQAGYSVVFGQRLWDSFVDFDGPYFIDLPGADTPLHGGHCMRITGYESAPGGKLYRVTNSWSKHWRENGHVWYTEDMVIYGVRDLTVLKWR